MIPYILSFAEVDRSSLAYVGGKGANLGELCKAGFPVPGGFCITTRAYRDFLAASPEMEALFAELDQLDANDLNHLRQLGARIRTHLLQLEISGPIKKAIVDAWQSTGTRYSYAVRSSATAEDLPTASFAGQQDTYLNIRGQEELLRHVQKCWASLFTDRAIAYRARNGFAHRQVYLSVVVQRMANPEVSGIMFTADPVTGNRKVVSIDASFGVGEAIVSGLVSADLYKVKEGRIIQKKVSEKKIAIYPLPEGGTIKKDLPGSKQVEQALTDSQILQLAELGKKIEKHYGTPQDIEFCVEGGTFSIVQSRPITSLYPMPDIPAEPLQVMISFGHIQMMTDAINPLGISVLKTIFPKHVFLEAGGRFFVNPTEFLRTRLGDKMFPIALENVFDETIGRAIAEVIERPEFQKVPPKPGLIRSKRHILAPIVKKTLKNLRKDRLKTARSEVEAYMEKKMTSFRQNLQNTDGEQRLEAVRAQSGSLLKEIAQNILPYILPYLISSILLKKIIVRLMGDEKKLYELNQSLPGNITSQMGLEIGDLADLVRELPEVEAYLKQATDKSFYEGLLKVKGGERFKQEFEKFMVKYGHRCPGEIDLTRPRWREAPARLVPAILGHMRSVKPGEHRRKFAEGEQVAREAASQIMERVKHRRFKAELIRRLIEIYRYTGGLREHHKYLLVYLMDECKKVILDEAEKLVEKGILKQAEDVYFLTLDELIQLVKGTFPHDVSLHIASRKKEVARYQTLTPPRVMTSEGEIITGSPRKGDFPEGALVGTPASAGVVEGKARIVLKAEEAHLQEGEIMIAPYTDPGWTPLFQSARALVTEVGGLMTHGSVVAREYGIPAVVGVDKATEKIRDGQMIRVNGNLGYVEIIGDENE
ncbi:MAG: phosphoenolpyruvate synthase [Thermoactinomyces sp.]